MYCLYVVLFARPFDREIKRGCIDRSGLCDVFDYSTYERAIQRAESYSGSYRREEVSQEATER